MPPRERTLMGCSDLPSREGGGVGAPHQVFSSRFSVAKGGGISTPAVIDVDLPLHRIAQHKQRQTLRRVQQRAVPRTCSTPCRQQAIAVRGWITHARTHAWVCRQAGGQVQPPASRRSVRRGQPPRKLVFPGRTISHARTHARTHAQTNAHFHYDFLFFKPGFVGGPMLNGACVRRGSALSFYAGASTVQVRCTHCLLLPSTRRTPHAARRTLTYALQPLRRYPEA